MLVIHHLGVSQSERVIWLCEELGLPYELVRYERDAGTRLAPAEYKALHPFGTAPVIADGALRLAESGAIVEYLITPMVGVVWPCRLKAPIMPSISTGGISPMPPLSRRH